MLLEPVTNYFSQPQRLARQDDDLCGIPVSPTPSRGAVNSTTQLDSHYGSINLLPDMRVSQHRLHATPVVPISAFVDYEARQRTALAMKRRFGNNSGESKE
uniref:Uncharacterized protein n=1 Tax=Lygus hesperus TaxID=30085 RepID=A0A146KNE7_LYGHE